MIWRIRSRSVLVTLWYSRFFGRKPLDRPTFGIKTSQLLTIRWCQTKVLFRPNVNRPNGFRQKYVKPSKGLRCWEESFGKWDHESIEISSFQLTLKQIVATHYFLGSTTISPMTSSSTTFFKWHFVNAKTFRLMTFWLMKVWQTIFREKHFFC